MLDSVPTSNVSALDSSTMPETDGNTSRRLNMLELLENETYADVIIGVEGKEFAAHQVLLAAGSQKFADMLKTCDVDLQSMKKHLKFTDISAAIMKELLKFVYSREEPDFQDLQLDQILEMVAAATKYAINDLVPFAVSYLMGHLDESNVIKILLVADEHKLSELKKMSIDFLHVHKSILNNETCTNLKQNPELLAEICLMLAKDDNATKKEKSVEEDVGPPIGSKLNKINKEEPTFACTLIVLFFLVFLGFYWYVTTPAFFRYCYSLFK